MLVLNRARALARFVLAAGVVLSSSLAVVAAGGTAQAAPAAPAASAAPAAAAGSGGSGGGCYVVATTWICVYSGGNGGSGGSGSSTVTCTYAPAPAGILQRTGVGPPAPGYQWDIMTCPGSSTVLGGQLVQVSKKTGAPAISPLQLLKIAIGELRVPTLPPATAPPRGKDGLVGLPEWFWVPAGAWHSVSVTVNAGPVWATAVATPTRLSYDPGGGLPATTCAGPGRQFSSSAGQQSSNCSYTYVQPSAGQPGNAFQAALFVIWTISWTGSGGAGGVITNGYTTGTTFGVRIAQAEALVTTP